jgi:hypothetical protein
MPVDIKEPFATTMARMKAAQPAIQKRQADLLADRYDLANRAATGATMSRGKPLQEGVRVKLPAGTTWDQLAGMSPTEIRDRNLLPDTAKSFGLGKATDIDYVLEAEGIVPSPAWKQSYFKNAADQVWNAVTCAITSAIEPS